MKSQDSLPTKVEYKITPNEMWTCVRGQHRTGV